MRERFGDRFVVVNRGVPGFDATDQARLLAALELIPGDIVVFYDGTNEIHHSMFYGEAAPEISRAPDLSPATWSTAERIADFLWTNTREYSSFARRFFDVEANRRSTVPVHLQTPEKIERLLPKTRSDFRRALQEAGAVCRSAGVTFVHFLQPTIFTQVHRTPYEQNLVDNHNMIFHGLQIAHENGYPALREVLDELKGEVLSYDLSDVFDVRARGAEYFVDDCHVTHDANSIVARRIFEKVAVLIDSREPIRPRATESRRRERCRETTTG